MATLEREVLAWMVNSQMPQLLFRRDMPKEACLVTHSFRVPPKLVALIKDLYTNHSVTIRAELESQPIITDNGFKQGCTLAPDLFTIILDTIVATASTVVQTWGQDSIQD